MNTLEIVGLQKAYPGGIRPLNNLSITLTDGMFGLLGPNGAGKSSLMRTIVGLQKPDSGTILFNGVDIVSNPEAIRKHLGYLPQEFGVYPRLSAFRLLEHLAILKGITDKQVREEQIEQLLEQTNLTDHRNRAVHSFSGGMRQRFGIAQALLGDPKIVIVDEPTAGLDPEERNRFNNLLSEIGENVIIILSTHIVDDVRDLCPNMAILAKGIIIKTGTPEIFIEELQGRVWIKTIHKTELERYKQTVNVISSRLNAGALSIHVISEKNPGQGFTEISPDLEDVYFSTLEQSLSHV